MFHRQRSLVREFISDDDGEDEIELRFAADESMVHFTQNNYFAVIPPDATDGIRLYVPFPVEVLPSAMARLVKESADSIGCDMANVALPLLTVFGAAIGNTHRLRLKDGWDVPPLLWSVMIGRSGSGKSPGWKAAINPLVAIQREARRLYMKALAQWKEQFEEFEQHLSEWKKTKDGPKPQKPAQPSEQRYSVTDTTIEALAPLLSENPRGLLLSCDELAGWVGSFDRYAKGSSADASHWLSMFNATPIRIDRKTGVPPTIYVESAAVSITGNVPPGVFRRAIGSEHRENGLLYRFLVAWPPHKPRQWSDSHISTDTVNAVTNSLTCLL